VSEDDVTIEQAKKHLKLVRDFYYHLMVYVFINLLIVVLDRRAGTSGNAVFGLDWAYWLIIFWGIGVAGHAISVFLGDHRAHRMSGRD
jgi:hypothetical protein